MEEFPTIMIEHDFAGNDLTWDLDPHATDEDWELFKIECIEKRTLTKPETLQLRPLGSPPDPSRLDILKNPSGLNPVFHSLPEGSIRNPFFVRAVLETDYCSLTRSPRIYCNANHWGICLVYKTPDGREFLRIPQVDGEMQAAERIRTFCRSGSLGICPGLTEDKIISETGSLLPNMSTFSIKAIRERIKEVEKQKKSLAPGIHEIKPRERTKKASALTTHSCGAHQNDLSRILLDAAETITDPHRVSEKEKLIQQANNISKGGIISGDYFRACSGPFPTASEWQEIHKKAEQMAQEFLAYPNIVSSQANQIQEDEKYYEFQNTFEYFKAMKKRRERVKSVLTCMIPSNVPYRSQLIESTLDEIIPEFPFLAHQFSSEHPSYPPLSTESLRCLLTNESSEENFSGTISPF